MTEFGGTNSAGTGESTSESTEEGGANNAATGAESASISAGGTAVFNNETEYVQSGFTQGNESTSTPISNSNILWGAAATAILGAILADWQRKREEEEARKRAEAAAREEEGGRSGKKKTPGQIAYEKMMKQKRIVGVLQAEMNEQAEQQAASQQARDEYRAGEKAYDIAQAEAIQQQARDDIAQAEAIQQQARDDYRAGERGYAVQQAEEVGESQYDLTSWMPLVINRNLASPELGDMRFYNILMQPGNLPTVKTYPSSAFGPWITELFGNFLTLNTGGGRWDIKLEMQDEFRNGLGDKDSAHVLCSNSGACGWVDYSTAGNILYGATAADVGVPRWMSKLAGGFLEAWEGTAKWENKSNWLEDPYDTNAVNFGYDLYESTGGNITEEAFRNALTDEVLNSLQPPPEGFVPPFEAQPQPNTYPADRFDQPETEEQP